MILYIGLLNVSKRSLAKETDESENDAIRLADASKVPREFPPKSIEDDSSKCTSSGNAKPSDEIQVVTGIKSCKPDSAKTVEDMITCGRDNSVDGGKGVAKNEQTKPARK